MAHGLKTSVNIIEAIDSERKVGERHGPREPLFVDARESPGCGLTPDLIADSVDGARLRFLVHVGMHRKAENAS